METLDSVFVTAAEGLALDYRSGRASTKKGRKRQVSLIEAQGVADAFQESGATLEWFDCRRNLLIEGLQIPRAAGTRVGIGQSLVIEITDRCDPCAQMDARHDGLRDALEPDWRCGFLGRVIEDGEIAVGDDVRIME